MTILIAGFGYYETVKNYLLALSCVRIFHVYIANSLRRFGEGSKVCCEIVMMATDAGLIPEGEEVLAVAGTAKGADTVMIIKSAASKRFLDLRVLEILAKPRT